MSNEIELDSTVRASARDSATVTSEGRRIESVIDGVRTRASTVHVDHRGRVFEIYPGVDEFWTDPVVYCYSFTIRVATSKGWGLHEHKDDRYTLISGEALVLLYDARSSSSTHGVVQTVPLSEQGTRQLLIPAGVWHLTLNIGESEAFLINHPTAQYVHSAPDRLLLPWDSPEIPVDVAALFPVQRLGRTGPAAQRD